MYAKRFGQDTPIPSMQLCIENVDQAGGCAYGYACVYTDTISWASPTQPLPMIRDPRAAFDQLFGVGATPAERAAQPPHRSQHPRLGHDRGGAISKGLGAGDRARLDQYLDDDSRDRAPHPEGRSAQLERRAARAAGRADRRAGLLQRAREADVRPAGDRVRRRHHARVLVQARARRSGRVYPESGVDARVPPASHHGENEKRVNEFAQINKLPRQPAAVLPREAEEQRRTATRTCSTRR